ncbi:MAG: TraR/DksA family transcriptional regulator [Chlamydiota bacterium]
MALKKNDIERFKRRLLEMKALLGASLKAVSDDVKTSEESKGYSQHQADEGTDDFGQTISIEVSTKEQQMIRQIDRALDKIEEGTYGICDVTGDEIPLKRLEAVPYANMTVTAQEKIEKGMM